jgi:hypothetical protein
MELDLDLVLSGVVQSAVTQLPGEAAVWKPKIS